MGDKEFFDMKLSSMDEGIENMIRTLEAYRRTLKQLREAYTKPPVMTEGLRDDIVTWR